jgi:hypothetical protein
VYFHFQTNFGTGSFENYWFSDGLQFFLPFNSRFLNVDGQKLCEKSALLVMLLLTGSKVGPGVICPKSRYVSPSG